MPVQYPEAERILEEELGTVEKDLLVGMEPIPPSDESISHFDAIFSSSTQAFREVLVGCVLARIQDRTINISLPYLKQGKHAYNGRTLDEKVVNPFLHRHRIPASGGPFLSTFRRSVRFDEDTRKGVKDKKSYDALLNLIALLKDTESNGKLLQFLRYLLFRFVKLREAATVQLSRLQRISLTQYDGFIDGLLGVPSGGRIPLMFVVSTFQAIKEHFRLPWTIEFQGINVADAATGTGGDVTIFQDGIRLLAVEVTERPVNRNRVVATFNTKIAPNGIEDYLFVTTATAPDIEAKAQAGQYFAQGHEVNFLEIKAWILMVLATIGKMGREVFNKTLTASFASGDTPTTLKVAWNNEIERLTTIEPATR